MPRSRRGARKTVYGVLWRLTPRDLLTLAAWENIAGGLYRAEMLPVRRQGRRRIGAGLSARGRARQAAPKAGYMELVIAAALEWQLPDVYIDLLQRLVAEAASVPATWNSDGRDLCVS